MYDQLHLNSCTANALAAALRFDEIKQRRRRAEPSRLFIYYNERVVANLVGSNAPVSLRDGYRSLARLGVCPESMWPYEIRRFRQKPSAPCYRTAKRTVPLSYYRLRRAIVQFRACLAEGYPFVFAFAAHRSALSRATARSGLIPVPARGDRLLGGHAVVAIGYQHARRLLIIRNSWGHRWGDHGYGYLPYAFLTSTSLSWDFWTMRRVS